MSANSNERNVADNPKQNVQKTASQVEDEEVEIEIESEADDGEDDVDETNDKVVGK